MSHWTCLRFLSFTVLFFGALVRQFSRSFPRPYNAPVSVVFQSFKAMSVSLSVWMSVRVCGSNYQKEQTWETNEIKLSLYTLDSARGSELDDPPLDHMTHSTPFLNGPILSHVTERTSARAPGSVSEWGKTARRTMGVEVETIRPGDGKNLWKM